METVQTVAVVDPDSVEVAAGFQHENLEGWVPELASQAEVFAAFDKALDYRGDITITRKDGTKFDAYIFDRKHGASLDDSVVRLYPANFEREADRPLQRDREAGVWQGPRRRQALGELGLPIQTEEGGGREKHRHSTRRFGLDLYRCPRICQREGPGLKAVFVIHLFSGLKPTASTTIDPSDESLPYRRNWFCR